MGARVKAWRARHLRGLIYCAQAGRCGICGGKLFGTKGTSLDHVVPMARGGRNERNLLLAHKRCNSIKGSRLPTGCEMILLDAVNLALARYREAC